MASPPSPWLTLEAAATAQKNPIETLQTLLTQSSPEHSFREIGYLFDREKHEAGEPCLQLLSARPSPNPDPTEPDTRNYDWDGLALVIQLRWQPGTPRKVLITTTTYDDFPIAVLVDADQLPLDTLPAAIQALLTTLQQDLPTRAFRHQQHNQGAKRATPAKRKTPVTQPTTPKHVAPEPGTPPQTQISLF